MTENNPQNPETDESRQPAASVRPPAWRYVLWLALCGVFIYYLSDVAFDDQGQTLSYSEFKSHVREDAVATVTMQGDRVTGEFNSGADAVESGQPGNFETTLPPVEDPDLMPLLEEHGVEVRARSQQSGWWQALLVGILPWVLILGLLIYASRKMQERFSQAGGPGGVFGFGKSKARRFHQGETSVTFDQVAGLDNAKQDLREITDYLVHPQRYRQLGAEIPKGIMLMGPPGTGKTLLARAVAGEAGVPFFSISGSEFIEMFVGVGASRVRDMFDSAKKEAPSIIFIDEIDSVGRTRGAGVGGGHDEREQTLNQILNEMDGFEPHETVVVLAATNRPDVLDPALLRPGRFDRKVTLDLPDRKARLAILQVHTRDVPLDDDVDKERLAAVTPGFSGADLENLVNESALLAGREKKQRVDMHSLMQARDQVMLGSPREILVSEEERALIACHEAGHALAAHLLPNADPLDKVTVIPRGRALGATEQIPVEERYNLKESYLRDRIGVMLGGYAAEKLSYGEVSSGAEDDLKQVTSLARHMVSHWGMSERIGPLAYRRGEEHVFLGREMAQQRDYSESTAHIIDEETGRLVREIEQTVLQLLQEHQSQLETLASTLVEKETLDAAAIQAVLDPDEAGADMTEARDDRAAS